MVAGTRRCNASTLVLLLAGCAAPAEAPEPVEDPEVTADPVEYPDPPPLLTAEEVEAAVAAALGGGLPDPLLPRDTYLALFAWGDADCPTGEGYNLPGDFQSCTSASGASYFGHAQYDTSVGGPGSFYLLGDAWITDPDGARFDGGGEILVVLDRIDEQTTFYAMLRGTWSYEASEGWMADEVTAMLTYFGARADADRWSAGIEGSVSINGEHLFFDELRFDPLTCPDTPTAGAIRIRDEAGRWYTIAPEEDCSGCGPVTVGGEEIGTACLRLSDAVADLVEILGATP